MQLDLWGLDYFDLFLVHFPIALAYVEPEHRYPPEWWGDDGKVHLRTLKSLFTSKNRCAYSCHKKIRHSRRHGAPWKDWSMTDLPRISASGWHI
jgi:hypothetical protein